jgi:hypothetical protein
LISIISIGDSFEVSRRIGAIEASLHTVRMSEPAMPPPRFSVRV